MRRSIGAISCAVDERLAIRGLGGAGAGSALRY